MEYLYFQQGDSALQL